MGTRIATRGLFVLALTMTLGCGRSEEVCQRTIPVELNADKTEGNEYLLDKISVDTMMPLKASSLSIVEKIRCSANNFYALDIQKHQLYAFDRNGSLLYTLDKTGRARNEYIKIDDFAVDGKGDVFVFDASSAKIVHFDSKGEYVNDVKVEYAEEFLLDSKGQFVLRISEEGCVKVATYDNEGKKVEQVEYATRKKPINLSYLDGMAEKGDSILFTLPLENTIYVKHRGKITPWTTFDFGEYNVSEKVLSAGSYKNALAEIMKEESVSSLNGLGIYKDNVFVTTSTGMPIVVDPGGGAKAIGRLKYPYSVLFGSTPYIMADGKTLTIVDAENFTNAILPVVNTGDNKDDILPSKEQCQGNDTYNWIVVSSIKK